MSNIYNILASPPIFKKKLSPHLEAMAKWLVESGRMRIEAEEMGNFVRLNLPQYGIDLTFSRREINDPKLFPETKKFLQSILSLKDKGTAADKAMEYMREMRARITRKQPINPDTEQKLARAFVQCNHPAVIELLLLEKTEIFITFSHNIGDMLNMEGWQHHGKNSGMQASGPLQNAVYISCGGDPFVPEKKVQYSGDGFGALARMMIIGAQETGHFADMIRAANGRVTSRHSADLYGKAKPKVKEARRQDISDLENIIATFKSLGLEKITEAERALKFFREKHGSRSRRLRKFLLSRLLYRIFLLRARGKNTFLKKMPKNKYPATLIYTMLLDMRFNLAPKADVYARENPEEEEGIACIEALARVPQQAIKWGREIAEALMPRLYHIYYSEVIPECQRYLRERGVH